MAKKKKKIHFTYSSNDKKKDTSGRKFNLLFWAIAFGITIIIQSYFLNKNYEVLPYSEFLKKLKTGQVSELTISDSAISGTYKNEGQVESAPKLFKTIPVETELAKILNDSNVKFSRIIENTFFRDMISWILPTLIFFGIWFWVVKKMTPKDFGGGFMSVGKSKAKVYVENDTGITFDDVAGVDEAKGELQEIVNFLKEPKKYGRLGGRMPKGVLLVGPPGTGKTLLAKAVAGEAKVPFFSISGSEFVEMFVGVGAARVRDLFLQARQSSPCIIFIDELDALGKARGLNPMGGHDEKEQTLNQLLTELDGFDSRDGIILLGATNRPEILDSALLRAGRFDRQVLVDRPDSKGRIEILKVHSKKVHLAEDVELDQIAALTTGFSGADLANLVNEAALVATRRNADVVTTEDFTVAIERIVAGLEKKNRLLNSFEREVVAYHEMGHAIVAMALKSTDTVHKVSIIPRGVGALGYTIQRPTEDRYLLLKEELLNKISTLLAGRASEFLIFNHFSTGASDDLAKATDIARSMISNYGMSNNLGHVQYGNEQHSYLGQRVQGERTYSEETAREIDIEIKQILNDQFDQSLNILKKNKAILENSSKELLLKETLTSPELEQFFSQIK